MQEYVIKVPNIYSANRDGMGRDSHSLIPSRPGRDKVLVPSRPIPIPAG